MGRKLIYWVVTGLLALSGVFAGVNYLLSSQQAIQGFAHVGYPQQLRVLLGMAKLLGGITLIVPGLLTLEGVGLRGVHIRVDSRGDRTLSAQRRRGSLLSAHPAGPSVCLIVHAAGKSATGAYGGN